MPVYVDKKTKRLFIQFRFRGSYYKERLPEGVTRKEAERLEIKVKSQLLFERHGDEPKANPTFEQFIQTVYLPWVEANLTKNSFDFSMRICKFALKTLKGRKLRSIKAADIEIIKAGRMALPTPQGNSRSASTIVKELSVLSKIFSMAVKNDAMDYNPCQRVDKPKIDNIQNKVLSETKQAEFLAAFKSDWARDIAIFALYTGMSQKDIFSMTKFQVDLETETAWYTRTKTKTHVIVPLNTIALAILEKRMRLPGSLLFPSPRTGGIGTQTKTAFRSASRRCGVEILTIRDMRRTFGSRLDERNVNSKTIADLLGHSDMRSVHRYMRGSEIKRTAVKSLESTMNDANIVPMEKQRKQK